MAAQEGEGVGLRGEEKNGGGRRTADMQDRSAMGGGRRVEAGRLPRVSRPVIHQAEHMARVQD